MRIFLLPAGGFQHSLLPLLVRVVPACDMNLHVPLFCSLGESHHVTQPEEGNGAALPTPQLAGHPQAYPFFSYSLPELWLPQNQPFLWRSRFLQAVVFSGSFLTDFLMDLILPVFHPWGISQNIYFITRSIPF